MLYDIIVYYIPINVLLKIQAIPEAVEYKPADRIFHITTV